jgi:hypothetical protein
VIGPTATMAEIAALYIASMCENTQHEVELGCGLAVIAARLGQWAGYAAVRGPTGISIWETVRPTEAISGARATVPRATIQQA